MAEESYYRQNIRALYRAGGWTDRGGGIHIASCPCPVCDPQGRTTVRPRVELDAYPELAADPEAPVFGWAD